MGLMGEVRAESLLRALDPAVRSGLTPEQEGAIRAAVRQDAWWCHPVDIRLSLPAPFGRLYVTLVAGRERRHPARIIAERGRHPLRGAANVTVTAVLAAILGLAGVAVYLLAAGARIP